MEKATPVNLDGAIVDTNVVVRFLRSEDRQHAEAVRVFEAAQAAGNQLVLLDVVVAETIFVLTAHYGLGREAVADSMAKIINHGAIGVANPAILGEALARYATTKLHFVDCYLVAMAKAAGREIATFDKELAARSGERGAGSGERGTENR